ncbi:MAG TPA: Hsp20/alpha crystallin family protein [Gaiellaceae bacterium]|nr:Hsp20/alpha crystallin family protein [Gaiellaceae bacterium]
MARERDIRGLPEEIEELFADLWQVPRFSGLRRGFRPNVDCVRRDDPPALHVTFELAGVAPEDVHVDATPTDLLVRGVRRRHGERARVLQLEIEVGPFERHVHLPEEVDVERATATHEQGLLTIVLPVAERPPPGPRSVPIEVSPRD